MANSSDERSDVGKRASDAQWLAVERKSIDNLPSHSIIRMALVGHPTVEVLVPRAVIHDDYIAHLGNLLTNRPPPPR